MVSRYDATNIFLNTEEEYQQKFKERNTKFISQFATPNLSHPTIDEIASLDIVNHTWTTGDRFWKLSGQYYGRPDLWWVIAWFNRMPTEGQVKLGDVVAIPLPLDKILEYLEI